MFPEVFYEFGEFFEISARHVFDLEEIVYICEDSNNL